MKTTISRRAFLEAGAGWMLAAAASAQTQPQAGYFKIRGAVIMPRDAATWPWAREAQAAGLTTLAFHIAPSLREGFVNSESGRVTLQACKEAGLDVEYEAHAMNDLLPRDLFAKEPAMFRMDDTGRRVPDANCCCSSQNAMELIAENAAAHAKRFPPTTHRHFYWIDDAQPMCRCPACKELSDSDQALLIELRILRALRRVDPQATLAHIAYANTMTPPKSVKPEPGIFLEFAPIERRHDRPLSDPSIPQHARLLEALDANIALFGADGAQALEYWLDESRFCGWKPEVRVKIPWDQDVVASDLACYGSRGIRNVTTFAVWADGAYKDRFGDPPVRPYGDAMRAVAAKPSRI